MVFRGVIGTYRLAISRYLPSLAHLIPKMHPRDALLFKGPFALGMLRGKKEVVSSEGNSE